MEGKRVRKREGMEEGGWALQAVNLPCVEACCTICGETVNATHRCCRHPADTHPIPLGRGRHRAGRWRASLLDENNKHKPNRKNNYTKNNKIMLKRGYKVVKHGSSITRKGNRKAKSNHTGQNTCHQPMTSHWLLPVTRPWISHKHQT